MDLDLRGKAVLLVGGTRGIGRETARLLAQEGARLALIARDAKTLEETANEVRAQGGQAVTIPADVTDPGQAQRAVAHAAGALGKFDVLICTVGRGFRGPFAELDDAKWREAFDLDFFAPARLVRLAIPHMAPGGRVVLLGAASAKQPSMHQSPSNAAKAALANLTRSLAEELAPQGLAVNCVSPGRILSDRRHERLAAEAEKRGIPPEAALREDAAHIPLGRLGKPAEVAAIVVFLASPRAAYMTGQSVLVDGGLVRTV